MSASAAATIRHRASSDCCITRSFDFFNRDRYELRGDELIRIEVPTDAGMSVHREWLLIRPRTDWTVGAATYRPGSLLAADYDEFLSGTAELSVVFEPDEHSSLENYAWTRDHLVLVTLVDVASHVELVTPGYLGAAADRRHPAEHQHRAGGHRRVRRRDVPGLKRFRSRRRGCCGGGGRRR